MKPSVDLTYLFSLRSFLVIIICLSLFRQPLHSQNYEARSIIYNSLVGALSGGIGAMINKKPEQKWFKAFGKGFLIGTGGGAIVYAGKKMNYLVGSEHEPGYAWASRAVFSLGNSIVENASSNINVWTRWHFDIGFVRLEFNAGPFKFVPRLMPSTMGGVVFVVSNGGKLNFGETLHSGTLTFNASVISFAPQFVASTPSNAILITGITGTTYYQTYAHEMIHTFQFQEFSGLNYFFKPIVNKWEARSNGFRELHKWFYLDRNYEAMLIHYFLIQGGYQKRYCSNFLENEAEFLSTGRPACN